MVHKRHAVNYPLKLYK